MTPLFHSRPLHISSINCHIEVLTHVELDIDARPENLIGLGQQSISTGAGHRVSVMARWIMHICYHFMQPPTRSSFVQVVQAGKQ